MTPKQWRIVLALAAAVVVVLAALGWSVWSTLHARPVSPTASSPLPTATRRSTVTPRPTATLYATPSPRPTFDPAQAGTIAERIADARGLLPRWNTPLTPVDFHDMTVALYRQAMAHPPFPQSDRMILRLLSLWPREAVRFDPRAQAQTSAAIYIPAERQVYLRRDWEADPATLELQLAYGYARALADQIGELPQLRQEAGTLDRRLALQALGDGDACFALSRYADLTPGTQISAVLQATTPRWSPETDTVQRLSRLPLTLGNRFAAQLYATGGISTLNQALLRPPRSTEQLLHPRRYLEGDEPQVLPPLAVDLGHGWTLTRSETLGEALLGQALRSWSLGKYGEHDATDWGGDLLQLWQGPDQAYAALWQVSWDSGLAAGHFHALLLRLMPRPLLQGAVHSTPRPVDLPPGHWWAGNQGALYVWRHLDTVYLVWGSDEAAVLTLIRQLPARP